MLRTISGQEVVYFARCLVGMCGKVPVAPNSTNTIAQLKVPTFPICGRENVCSIPQCFAKSTQEIKLNRSEHCLPRHLL
jgi:hypothetical protein